MYHPNSKNISARRLELNTDPAIVPSISSKQLKDLNIFWIGFIIYSLGSALVATDRLDVKICQGIEIIGLILFFVKLIALVQFKFDNSYLAVMYVIYCAWLLGVIFRKPHDLANYSYLKSFLFNPYEGMLYFTPLILLFPRNLVFYKKLFDTAITMGILYLLYDLIFIKDLLNSDHSNALSQGLVETFSDLSFSSGFIVLTYAYHTKKKQLIALAVTVAALLLAVIRARRGLLLMYSEILLVSYLLFIFHSKLKFLVIYLTIFAAIMGALYLSGVYRPANNKFFGFLVNRGSEDTRATVELYFHDDMKPKDWLIGRGANGQYFCPDVEENQLTNYRHTIETGFEQTILKGGIISLGLFLLIAVPAIFLGIFYSKNILSKVAGIWILMSLINSYPGTINAFTLQYLLVWVSIGICYSKEIRRMPQNEIKNIFLDLQNVR